jgi:hypothetical protein
MLKNISVLIIDKAMGTLTIHANFASKRRSTAPPASANPPAPATMQSPSAATDSVAG